MEHDNKMQEKAMTFQAKMEQDTQKYEAEMSARLQQQSAQFQRGQEVCCVSLIIVISIQCKLHTIIVLFYIIMIIYYIIITTKLTSTFPILMAVYEW